MWEPGALWDAQVFSCDVGRERQHWKLNIRLGKRLWLFSKCEVWVVVEPGLRATLKGRSRGDKIPFWAVAEKLQGWKSWETEAQKNQVFCTWCLSQNYASGENAFPQVLGEMVKWLWPCVYEILNSDFIWGFKQDFFKLVKSYHWMGLVQVSTNGSWQWEDGSILLPNL